MTPTDFARIVHSLSLLAISEGHDPGVLLKSACAGIVLAADPTDRVTRLDVKLTSTASLQELEVAVGFDVATRNTIRGKEGEHAAPPQSAERVEEKEDARG